LAPVQTTSRPWSGSVERLIFAEPPTILRRQGDVHQAVAAGILDAGNGELLEHEALAMVEDFLAGLVGIDPADRDRAGVQAA
jgi:hypothetical protein